MNDRQDLDRILSVLENPIRRKILKKLSTDTNYPLQLARELNVSQQAIMKHLKVLEEAGFVEPVEERSDKGGPPRKVYVPKKRFSVRIDLGPSTYEESFYSFESYGSMEYEESEIAPASTRLSVGGEVTGEMLSETAGILPAYTDPMLEKLRKNLEAIMVEKDRSHKIAMLRSVISSLNSDLAGLEERRKKILELRERAFEETNKIITESTTDYIEREVYSMVIKEEIDDLEIISHFLQTRSKVIAKILETIRHQTK
jgi:predicted transcriptional regulator